MVYKKIESETGAYQSDVDGALFDILESTKVVGPLGVNVNWDTFNNIDEAAAAYGLTRIPEPEPEEPKPEPPTESIDYIVKQILSEEINS